MPQKTQSNARRHHVAESRRVEVSELYLKGWFQAEIAKRVGVSYVTVYDDIKLIHEEWRKIYARNVDEKVMLELARVDRVERAAWEGYERSQQDAETNSKEVTRTPGKKPSDPPEEVEKIKKVRSGQAGEAKWLAIIQNCTEQRLKLIPGLSAPQRHFHSADESFVPVVTIVVDNRKDAEEAMAYGEFKNLVIDEEGNGQAGR